MLECNDTDKRESKGLEQAHVKFLYIKISKILKTNGQIEIKIKLHFYYQKMGSFLEVNYLRRTSLWSY